MTPSGIIICKKRLKFLGLWDYDCNRIVFFQASKTTRKAHKKFKVTKFHLASGRIYRWHCINDKTIKLKTGQHIHISNYLYHNIINFSGKLYE